MSGWLSTLAKHGETFLDNLDQQAGAAIDTVEKKVVEKVEKIRTPTSDSMDRTMPNRAINLGKSFWFKILFRKNTNFRMMVILNTVVERMNVLLAWLFLIINTKRNFSLKDGNVFVDL